MMNLGVFYKMADLKDNFREWLIQQGTKPGTITSYLSRLQKISHQNWDMLTINIIPLLVRYYELANKEYYLDRVTILQALEYFNTISDNIYETTKSDIKLSLFDGQKDYFICDTDLKSLYDDLWLINRHLYESNDTLESKHNSNIDLAKLYRLILEIKENYEDIKRIYDMKKASIDKEIKGLEDTQEKYKTIDNNTKDKIVNIFTIAGNISYIFQHASPSRQNELLKMLLKDCQLNGKRLEYTLRKPFDMLVKDPNAKSWPNLILNNLDEFDKVKM